MIRKIFPHIIFLAIFSFTSNYAQTFETNWKPAQEGNKIILIRHALAPGGGDPEGFKLIKAIQKRLKIDDDDIVKKGAKLEDILTKFSASVEKVAYVIAHNLKMNESVVAAEYIRTGMDNPMFRTERICLMQEGTYFCKIPNRRGSYKWPSLTELHAICFQQRYSPANNARADVIATARCFIKLMKTGQLEDLFDEEE